MAQALSQSTSHKNARVVLDTPHVKSAETRKLSNADVSEFARNVKSADPSCYYSPVSQKADPAVDAAGLFETVNQERHMTSTKPCEMEARWSEIEAKHNLRCLWSEVIGNRTIQVECLWVPSAGVTILVTKHYEHPIPKASYKKPFPKMTAHYAYFPAGGVTWETMDEALASIKGEQTQDEAAEINAA